MSTATAVLNPSVEHAIVAMLDQYQSNSWMLEEYWPQNEPHVRLMIKDVMACFPANPNVRLLDVGCMNGYMSFIFQQLGYDVTGTDGWDLEDRRAIFERAGIKFFYSNMNNLQPFQQIAAESFEVVIVAQVIEHILNHPLGLIRSLAGAMRRGGIMILTTPNPANIMNAVRILKGRSMLWGTQDFIDEPKFDGDQVISKGDIHYREYTRDELSHMLTAAGLHVERSQYLGLGYSEVQSPLKRLLKNNPIAQKLMTQRLFASNHYFLARRVS